MKNFRRTQKSWTVKIKPVTLLITFTTTPKRLRANDLISRNSSMWWSRSQGNSGTSRNSSSRCSSYFLRSKVTTGKPLPSVSADFWLVWYFRHFWLWVRKSALCLTLKLQLPRQPKVNWNLILSARSFNLCWKQISSKLRKWQPKTYVNSFSRLIPSTGSWMRFGPKVSIHTYRNQTWSFLVVPSMALWTSEQRITAWRAKWRPRYANTPKSTGISKSISTRERAHSAVWST